MGEPKRKNSKQRTAKRRGSKRFKAGQLSVDTDGNAFRSHTVNPTTGMYRGRQVQNVTV